MSIIVITDNLPSFIEYLKWEVGSMRQYRWRWAKILKEHPEYENMDDDSREEAYIEYESNPPLWWMDCVK